MSGINIISLNMSECVRFHPIQEVPLAADEVLKEVIAVKNSISLRPERKVRSCLGNLLSDFSFVAVVKKSQKKENETNKLKSQIVYVVSSDLNSA
jgi:hypothetical protein